MRSWRFLQHIQPGDNTPRYDVIGYVESHGGGAIDVHVVISANDFDELELKRELSRDPRSGEIEITDAGRNICRELGEQ